MGPSSLVMTPHAQGVKGTEARFWERGRECIEFPVPGAMPITLKFPPFNLHMSLSQCCYLHFIDERQERKLLNVEAEPLTQICLIPKENSLSIFNFMLLLEKKKMELPRITCTWVSSELLLRAPNGGS